MPDSEMSNLERLRNTVQHAVYGDSPAAWDEVDDLCFARDRNKLKTLVHYVCWTVDPSVLGAIKLNKVLWVADLWSYVQRGAPITGEHYVKRQFGPVSPSIPGLIRELEVSKDLVTRRREVFEGAEKVDYFALTEPDISCFKPDEISLIDRAIHFVCYEHSAKGISDRTHDVIWELADIGEEIPYSAMLASVLGEVTPADVEWARGLAKSRVEQVQVIRSSQLQEKN